MFKTTSQNKNYWTKRKIDWETSYFNLDHPHRQLILKILSRIKFNSVLEIGCGAGANLYNIKKNFPNVSIGGVDLNSDALDFARKKMPYGVFELSPSDDVFFSDKSVDVTLTDACLIYTGPTKIVKTIKEIKRVTRNYLILVELNEPRFFKRWAIRLMGYNAYNYKKLLTKHGFYDVQIMKIPKEVWQGGPWEPFGYFIIAKI